MSGGIKTASIDRMEKHVATTGSEWNQDRKDAAEEFLAAVREADLGGWKAATKAQVLRDLFPVKASKSEKGWMEFCEEVLGRHAKTIGSYIRAARYCDEFVPAWRERMEELPPWYLVSELAGVEQSLAKQDLHDQLFGHKYGDVPCFRRALKGLREDLSECEEVDDRGCLLGGAAHPGSPTPPTTSALAPTVPEAGEGVGVLHPFWAKIKDAGGVADEHADHLKSLDRDRQVQLFGQVCERAEVDVLTADEIDEGLAGVLQEHIGDLFGTPEPKPVTPPVPGPTAPHSGGKGTITPTFTAPTATVVATGSGPALEVSEAEWRNEIATAMADERTFISHLKRGLLIKMKDESK